VEVSTVPGRITNTAITSLVTLNGTRNIWKLPIFGPKLMDQGNIVDHKHNDRATRKRVLVDRSVRRH